jgi:uncharacterized protein YggT (Ycf19 family)
VSPLLQYWYFHLPNFVLAAVMYSLLGRIILSFFAPPDWKNYIWRAFVRITDPVVRLVRLMTPAELPDILVLVFAFFWMMAARLALLALLASLNLLPVASAGGGG